MDQTKLTEAKVLLEEKKKKVLQQLEGIGKKTGEAGENFNAKFPEYGNADEDNATEIADYTTNLSLEKELEGSIRDINLALEKVADGTYGICDNCQKEIEPDRLAIMPEAVRCMACQGK